MSKQLLSRGALFVAALIVSTAALQARPVELEPITRSHAFGTPLAPGVPEVPLQLVIDDDSAESVFGFSGAGTREFIWFNRFAAPGFPFALDEVWALFPTSTDVEPGDAVEVVVYVDTDGDPTNGAHLVASFDDVVQVTDGATFSIFQVPGELDLPSTGDILIGGINRFYETGADPLNTLPAALDTTGSEGRSYYARWVADPPDLPDLQEATEIVLLDGPVAGNFMIRGFGRPVFAVPTLGEVGLLLLALLLASAGWCVIRQG